MAITADFTLVRRFNTAVVLDVLRRQAPLSRAELAARTGLNRSTISSIVNHLIHERLVEETILQEDRIGRPGMLLELNPAGGFAIGVEIGVDFISIIVTDFVANVLWHQRVSSDPSEGIEIILERAFALTEIALQQGLTRRLRPLGIGVGIPGLVDYRQSLVRLAPNLGWRDVPLRQLWSNRFHLPVFVENDGNAAALGEYYFGAARGYDNIIYINAGIGLGGGIILGGKLFRGSHGFAAEFGHIKVRPDGELCGCGKRGCLETVVSPRGLVRQVQQLLSQGGQSPLLGKKVDFDKIVNAAHQGDEVALQAIREVGVDLGQCVASLVDIFNPQLVVLGGSLNQISDVLLPVVEQGIKANALRLSCEELRLVASQHGTEACVMGAVALVVDDILSEPAFTNP